MGDVKNSLEEQVCFVAKRFMEVSANKEIQILSHFDTDGISSATIIIKALKRLDKNFSLKIIKSLEEHHIYELKKDKISLFIDLASNSLHYIEKAGLENVFIIDHHEISQQIPDGVEIINPQLHDKEKLSSSSLAYLFVKEIDNKNSDLAKLAILGMVGDLLEKEIEKLNSHILEDGEIKIKRGLLIYPATRPLNRTLEYSSNPYIPGITGNSQGVSELLKEINITPKNGKYPNLIDLEKDEMEKLVTAIMLRSPKSKSKDIIGNVFLIKLYNKLEDAREISAMVNACSRLGNSEIALQFLMESPKVKKKAEELYVKYKQRIIEALKFANETQKLEGKGFLIINARERIKDTMAGTIASILSSSSIYDEGTVIVMLAYYDNSIKISARIVGRKGRNLREFLANIIEKIGGEVGGHENAAGAIITKDKEDEFISLLKKHLEIEMIKV